ncbi:hypothetical protein GCK72_010052 [Caenorhabditis remanei]|uniref:Ubiquitin-like domain-containing protein n=2 Tax=Caenorhabditis remanei TaxID=31234 RepID=E3MCU6_CAERE|nr:hypothetical protein GCK72_010052 [Caenorhabditis remanei]EFO98494.1 hypothetical protein CRE_20337 [Caenorhabditis remanei]KAF1761795.1 hypothetical protein GCK72_010052 [Caenorhabditis remanei]
MSDSDDNLDDDYLERRRVALQKKRQPVRVYESDSDDDFPSKKKLVAKRQREIEESKDSDDDSFVEKPDRRGEHQKHRIEDVEGEYRRKIFRTDTVIHVQNEKNDALGKAMRLAEKMCHSKSTESPERVIDQPEDPADSSIVAASFPVTVTIVDCVSRLSSTGLINKHDLPLTSTFSEIRNGLAEKWKCRVDEVTLTYNGKVIGDSETLRDIGMSPLQMPQPKVEAFKEEKKAPEVFTVEGTPDHITIKAQLKDRKKPIHIEVLKETTVEEMMQKVINVLSEGGEKCIPTIETMKVMFDDEYCINTQTCEELGLEEADCIDIYC